MNGFHTNFYESRIRILTTRGKEIIHKIKMMDKQRADLSDQLAAIEREIKNTYDKKEKAELRKAPL